MDREGVREVCRLLYEADPDRSRELDTLCLMRDTVTAAGDCVVCLCVPAGFCLFTECVMRRFVPFLILKCLRIH